MKPTHGAEHERWLEEAVLGSLDALDAGAQAELARCEECQRSLRSLAKLRREIGSAAEEEREILRAAAGMGVAPGQELVASTLRAAAAASRSGGSAPCSTPGHAGDGPRREHRTAGAPPRRARWFALVAALVIAVAAGAYWLARPAARITNEILGGEVVFSHLEPRGDVRGKPRFSWEFTGAAPAGFVVHIRGLDSSADFEMDSVVLREPRWTIGDEQFVQLPPRFEWFVTAVGADQSDQFTSGTEAVTLLR